MVKKTFTIIELLVIISIIGILSGLFVFNFMEARKRLRDSQRKSDLKEIQKALEMYRQDSPDFSYPEFLPEPGYVFRSRYVVYIKKMPGDPLTKSPYCYRRSSNTAYMLAACLENSYDNEGSDCQYICSCSYGSKCYIIEP